MRIPGDRRTKQRPPDEIIERRDPPAAAANNDNDVVGTTSAGVIPVDEVDAVCTSMEKKPYDRYQQSRWVLTFAVAFPEKYSECDLVMYLHDYKGRIPAGSRLHAAASIAAGGLQPRQRITQSMFVGKMFRCKTRLARSLTGELYTVIDSLIAKLTG
jgi:hypothetical protein